MNKKLFYYTSVILILSTTFISFTHDDKGEPPVKAPFTRLDGICTNDWWNKKPNGIVDVKVKRSEVVAFGIYTLHNKVLKLSAQLFPLYPKETREVRLEIKTKGKWKEIQKRKINDIGWSALFRIENWDDTKDVPYRILHGESASFEGLIRKDPKEKNEIVMAGLSCNSNKGRTDWKRENIVKNINFQDPDIMFFAGDQSYDHREHTAAWLKFGLQFRETFRNRPCISIPDDHDVGQPNLWGEGGKKTSSKKGDNGGYYCDAEYVKMVERCQTANLPDPYDPTPVEQGIGVYYTSLLYGGVDFAILEDRKFKSGPNGKIPQIGPRPDHITDESYDPKSIDVEGLELLGKRQLDFLEHWGTQNKDKVKVVLSQTIFYGGAHLNGPKKSRLLADMDSNGWPQTGRNKALSLIKKAKAIHIAGDQHLATVVQHGIKEYEDGPWAFTVPAIVNNFYSRWWWPKDEKAGENANDILPWTGRYLDGFHNKITMHAYVNPDSPSNGGGYGLIRFNKKKKEVTLECWARFADVSNPSEKQFKGFPIVVKLDK